LREANPIHAVKDRLNLSPVDTQVHRRECVPARSIEGTEPGVPILQSGREILCPGNEGDEIVARLFVFSIDCSRHRRIRLDCGGAGFALGHEAVGEAGDDSGKGEIGDAEMIQRHLDRPIAAAVLETAKPRNEDSFPALRLRTGVHESTDHRPFTGEGGAELIPISPPAFKKEELFPDEEFECGKTGAGCGEDRLMGVIHGKRFPSLVVNRK
jgi:hypothetical protein